MTAWRPLTTCCAGSLLPLLRGEKVELHEAVFSEYPPSRLMLRAAEWTLVYYPGHPYGELYNLAEDPEQLTRLYERPDAHHIRWELASRLVQ